MVEVTLKFPTFDEALTAMLRLTRPLGDVTISLVDSATAVSTPPLAPAPPAPDAPPPAAATVPITLADIRAAVRAHGTAQGTAATQAILAAHGVTRLSDAPADVYPALLAALQGTA